MRSDLSEIQLSIHIVCEHEKKKIIQSRFAFNEKWEFKISGQIEVNYHFKSYTYKGSILLTNSIGSVRPL